MPHRLRHLACGLALGAFLWSVFLPAAVAQQTRTLDIRNGNVYVDGRPLTDEQLPDDLNLEGIEAHYQFMGIQKPIIELNGRLFAVDDGLRPVSEEEVRGEQASVILSAGTTPPSSRTASDSPAIDHRQYLNEVERSSRQLYERLIRERQMEQEAHGLAHTIRLMPEGPERKEKVDSLRSMLNDIFELKQENRRREIERLQRKIRELQKSIQKREKMRNAMIEQRLHQLLRASQNQ